MPAFRATGISVIKDGAILDSTLGQFIDPDDPASWVRKWVEDPGEEEAGLYHLNALTDLAENPRLILNGVALDWPDELTQVADVAACCRDLPLLAALRALRGWPGATGLGT